MLLPSAYSQLLQKLQLALDLSRSVGVVAESVNEDLKDKRGDSQASPALSVGGSAVPQRTCMCCLYCSWASYSLCWFFSLSSLVLIKFS